MILHHRGYLAISGDITNCYDWEVEARDAVKPLPQHCHHSKELSGKNANSNGVEKPWVNLHAGNGFLIFTMGKKNDKTKAKKKNPTQKKKTQNKTKKEVVKKKRKKILSNE